MDQCISVLSVTVPNPSCTEARNELEAIEKLTDFEGDVGDGYSSNELNCQPYYDGEAWDLLLDSDSEIASTLRTGFLAAFITDSNVTGQRTVHIPQQKRSYGPGIGRERHRKVALRFPTECQRP